MSNEKEKKGIFGRLSGNKKANNSCCCNIEIEEIPEEKEKGVDDLEKKYERSDSGDL